jgi:beta-glucosidase-like glycosyl hydrolase
MDDYSTMDSDWNMGKATLYRIHILLTNINVNTVNSNPQQTLNNLYALHKELIARMKDEELADAEKAYEEVKRLMNFRNSGYDVVVNRLYKYEKILRTVIRDRKLDLPTRMDPGRALLN